VRAAAAAVSRLIVGSEESGVVRNRLVFGVGGLVGLRVGFSVLSLGLGIFLARVLGPDGLGAYSYALALVALLTIPALLGLDQLLIRNFATYIDNSDWVLMKALLRRANRAVLMSSLVLVLLGGAVSLTLNGRLSPLILSTFWIALVLVPLIGLTRVRQSVLQGLHHVVVAAFPERIIQPALALIFIVTVYFWRGGQLTPPIAMSLNVLATAIALFVGAACLAQKMPEPVKHAIPVHHRIEWRRSAVPLLLLAGMNVLFGQTDTLILGAIKGAHAVGVYTAGSRVADLITFLLVAQNAAIASTVASLYSTGETLRLQRLVSRISLWTLIGSLPVGIPLILFGRSILAHVYGPAFSEAGPALVILSIGQLVNVGMGLNSITLMMTGHERASAAVVAFSVFGDVILNLFLVPHWGILGAAVATASSVILLNVLTSIVLYERTGINTLAFAGETFWLKT
jgi:O-antigen/teichoic acid export membrane protein